MAEPQRSDQNPLEDEITGATAAALDLLQQAVDVLKESQATEVGPFGLDGTHAGTVEERSFTPVTEMSWEDQLATFGGHGAMAGLGAATSGDSVLTDVADAYGAIRKLPSAWSLRPIGGPASATALPVLTALTVELGATTVSAALSGTPWDPLTTLEPTLRHLDTISSAIDTLSTEDKRSIEAEAARSDAAEQTDSAPQLSGARLGVITHDPAGLDATSREVAGEGMGSIPAAPTATALPPAPAPTSSLAVANGSSPGAASATPVPGSSPDPAGAATGDPILAPPQHADDPADTPPAQAGPDPKAAVPPDLAPPMPDDEADGRPDPVDPPADPDDRASGNDVRAGPMPDPHLVYDEAAAADIVYGPAGAGPDEATSQALLVLLQSAEMAPEEVAVVEIAAADDGALAHEGPGDQVADSASEPIVPEPDLDGAPHPQPPEQTLDPHAVVQEFDAAEMYDHAGGWDDAHWSSG